MENWRQACILKSYSIALLEKQICGQKTEVLIGGEEIEVTRKTRHWEETSSRREKDNESLRKKGVK